jgi:hypothetical protein
MSHSARLAVAAHLHVLMRRRLARATDVEWMASNRDYATEIIRLANESPHEDLHEWAAKLDAAFRVNGFKHEIRTDAVAAPRDEAGHSGFGQIVDIVTTPRESGPEPRSARQYVTSLR